MTFLLVLLLLSYGFDKGTEGFSVGEMYRPYIRTWNQGYEGFMDHYGPNMILTKFRKWTSF